MNTLKTIFALALFCLFVSCQTQKNEQGNPVNISGIYPHLAFYNNEGECGTGAVVPWANGLWAITYGPHMVHGSSDKLYEITSDLELIIRPESTGGTPANRLIHKESNQLFIGPYAIDSEGNVKVIPYEEAPGRYTGAARHLTDPENKIYIATMEEGFYEIDVHTLAINTLFTDGNLLRKQGDMGQFSPLLPGVHGKGLYSGQGVLVYSNNGEDTYEALEKFNVESGSLSEWDGKNWTVVRRNQFVEVTGPGGIYGNTNPETDPIWATGWDHKSVLLGVRDNGKWHFYRLPKASNTYDGAHGWNTEWPRIRDIGTPENPDYLMTMHGMFWRFPQTFSSSNTKGISPRSAYLKVIGDFTRWNDQLVFGCDDSAQKEFLNLRKAKGGIEGPGQSNSNLWFTSTEQPDLLGPDNAGGSVWMNETVKAGSPSDAFLFNGWKNRCAWLKNEGNSAVNFSFETDEKGNNMWNELKKISVPAKSSLFVPFESADKGEWIRVKADKNTKASASFVYASEEKRGTNPDPIFTGLSSIDDSSTQGGLLYGLGNDRRKMGVLANQNSEEIAYYEIDEKMNIVAVNDTETAGFIRDKFAVSERLVEIESGSVLIVDDSNRRWRLPLGNDEFNNPTLNGALRICREVATERDLFNCIGTFYELPAENADGFAKIRPISSHNLKINDYASYRGLLIMTGINSRKTKGNAHIFLSEDKKVAIWAGAIDDLWKLGKPTGKGGPWVNTPVKANVPSDPYLIGFYDQRSMELSHDSDNAVTFKIEVDPTGDGNWMEYASYKVEKSETKKHVFPKSFQGRWIRFSTNEDATATTWLEYK